MKKLSFATFALALSIPFAASASTVNITFGGSSVANAGIVSSQPGVKTVNFDSGTAPANYTFTPNAQVVQGSSENVYAAPTGDTSYYASTGTSNVNIDLSGSPANYFGLYWGSIDTYNTLKLTEKDGTVDTYTGTQIAALNSIPSNGTTSAYVNFSLSGSAWKSIQLSSSQFAFESDNHAFVTATPEPATWMLLTGGLAVAGLMLGRRKKSVA